MQGFLYTSLDVISSFLALLFSYNQYCLVHDGREAFSETSTELVTMYP